MNEVDLGLVALIALCVASVACGLAMRWVLRACSDRTAIARTRGKIVARLLEFRLFGDEPWLVLRAQRDVARQSFHLIRLLLLPSAILTVPMLFLFAQFDAIFGRAPLIPGQPAVVTMHWKSLGLISLKRRAIHLKDRARLDQIAHEIASP